MLFGYLGFINQVNQAIQSITFSFLWLIICHCLFSTEHTPPADCHAFLKELQSLDFIRVTWSEEAAGARSSAGVACPLPSPCERLAPLHLHQSLGGPRGLARFPCRAGRKQPPPPGTFSAPWRDQPTAVFARARVEVEP